MQFILFYDQKHIGGLVKRINLMQKIALILFVASGTNHLYSAPLLAKTDMEYVNHLMIEITDGIDHINTLVVRFLDLEDKQPLRNYLIVLQEQMKDLRRMLKELEVKKKTAAPGVYRQALDQTIAILHNLNSGLITPVYKCLVGKQTRAPLSIEDRADLLAAALKVSIDEFHANSSKELITQLKTLHTYLEQLRLNQVAETIHGVLKLLDNANEAHNHSLTEEEKIDIRKAILLKLKLNKA